MIYQIKNGSKQFLSNIIFDNINFYVKNNEKVAVVGRNGAGKSTLLKIITNEISLDSGDIYKNNNLKIGYLSQNAISNQENTIIEEVFSVFKDMSSLEKQIEDLSKELANDENNETLLRRYGNVLSKFEILGGYNYEYEMYHVLSKFDLKDQILERKISALSGGEKTKVAFAKLLLEKPDLLLLDEPTNHLDLETIEWLEGYLKNYPYALVVISHDKMFLDNIINRIWDIENKKIKLYAGNYSTYEILKEESLAKLETSYHIQQKEIKRLENVIDKFKNKPSKASFAKSKMKYLDKMDKITLEKADSQSFNLNFKVSLRGGNKVLEIKDLKIGYSKVLSKINLLVKRHDKLAIIGNNGSGKSTFIKTLLNEVKALDGEFLWGHNIEIGYFDQILAQVNSSMTVLDDLLNSYPSLKISEARSYLASFLFKGEEVFKVVNVLSGGEKARLALLKVMLSKANCLVLDEPTNHLDIISKQALAEAINNYDGTVIFVSHDRHFINMVANRLLFIKDESFVYNDNYAHYLENSVVNEEVVEKKVEKKVKINKRSYSNNWIVNIEKDIKQLEMEIKLLKNSTFNEDIYSNHIKLEEVNGEIDLLEKQLLKLELEYLEYLNHLEQ